MTSPIEIILRRLMFDLRDAEAHFAVVGGLAVGAHTGPRFTRDVDVAVSVTSDAQAEELISSLIILRCFLCTPPGCPGLF